MAMNVKKTESTEVMGAQLGGELKGRHGVEEQAWTGIQQRWAQQLTRVLCDLLRVAGRAAVLHGALPAVATHFGT